MEASNFNRTMFTAALRELDLSDLPVSETESFTDYCNRTEVG